MEDSIKKVYEGKRTVLVNELIYKKDEYIAKYHIKDTQIYGVILSAIKDFNCLEKILQRIADSES